MMTIVRTLRLASVLLAAGALSAFAAPAALGALVASPNPSTTGNYTVLGSVPTARSYEWFSLIETAPGGTTQTFGVTDPARIDHSFSGKTAGSWVYRVEGCYLEQVPGLQEAVERCDRLGSSLSAVVRSSSAVDLPSFGDTPVPPKSWLEDSAIDAFAFEAATGGSGTLTYTASGFPAGVTMSSSRLISGTPTAAGSGAATIIATDANDNTVGKSFLWTVSVDVTPSFGKQTVSSQSWVASSEIAALASPVATSGNAPLSYGARGLPAGVSLVKDPDTGIHTFMGTPEGVGSGTATLMAIDNDGDRATLSFAWTVGADTAPSFGTASVSAKTWTVGNAISVFALPAAAGGNGTLSYGVRGLPESVTVSPSRQVSGVPLAVGTGTATLTAMDADGDTATLAFGWTVTSSDAPSGALLSVNPDPTTTNDFTISGSYVGTRSYESLTLTEAGPAGHTQAYSPSSGRFSQAIANRANGSYSYTLTGCYSKQVPGLQEINVVCERIGDPLTVTVAGPAPDSVAAQLDDTWEARVGDIDGNALKDVYLKRTSAAAGGGLLPDVLLRQAAGGVISVEPAPPGSTNASTAATWTVNTALDVILNDIDMDGFVDILLRGMHAAVGASGATATATVPDQIVYAPGRRPEVVLNAVDDGVKNFLSEVNAWFRDPTYFTTRVREETATIVRYRTQCLSDLGSGYGDDLDDVCFRIPIVDTLTIQVPTNLSTEARAFAGQFGVDEGQIDLDVTLGSSAAITLNQILNLVFGVEIFAGRLETACTGSFRYDADTEILCDDTRQIGRILLHHATVNKQDTEGYDPTADREATPVGYQRDLTTEEKTLAEEEGLDTIDLSRVRIEHVPEAIVKEDLKDLGEDALEAWYTLDTHPYTIFVPEHVEGTNDDTHFEEDFTGDTGLESILIHELTHVHQRNDSTWTFDRRGDSVLDEGKRAYGYRTRGGALEHDDFWEFSDEEQAQILQDRFLLKNGIPPTYDCRNPPSVGTPCNRHPSDSLKAMYDELNGLTNIPEDDD